LQRRMSAGRLCTWVIVSGVLLGGAGRIERHAPPSESARTEQTIKDDPRTRLGAFLTHCDANPRVIQIGCDREDGLAIGLGFLVQQDDGEVGFATAMHVVGEGQCMIAPWVDTWYQLDAVTRGAVRPDAVVFGIPQSAAPDGALKWASREPIIGETVTMYLRTSKGINEVSATVTHREWPSGAMCWAVDTGLGAGSSGGPVIAADGTVLGIMTGGAGNQSQFYDALSILKLEGRGRTISELRLELQPQMRASAEAERARHLMLKGKLAKAMPLLRAALVTDPRNEHAADWLAEALVKDGKASEAIQVLEATLTLLGDDAYLTPNELIRAYMHAGNTSGAFALVDRLLVSGRIHISAGAFIFNASASRESLRGSKEYPETCRILSRLIDLFPLHCDYYLMQARVQTKAENFAVPAAYCIDRSIECREMAIRLHGVVHDDESIVSIIDQYGTDGLSGIALWQAGGSLCSLGRIDQGILLMERAWAISPQYKQLPVILGWHFRTFGDEGRAMAYLIIASELDPTNVRVHAGLAGYMRSRCTWEEAEAVYSLMPKAGPDAGDAYVHNRAEVLWTIGQTVRAMELIEAREWIEEPVLLHLASQIAGDLGELDLALMYARLALEANPDNPKLREWVEQYN
jgi:tetratricopeptide (TPR) repeat protein